MAFRDDYDYVPERGGFKHCVIGLAFSRDGIHWDVQKEPFLTVEDMDDPDITRVYDPRLTVIDDRVYLCFAVDTNHGLRGGIAVTDDFQKIEVLSLTVPDNRNMVLFPEKVGGRYVRLERPFPVYSRGGRDRFDTWLSYSPDLRYWGDSKLVLPVEAVPYANDKTGPGAPPSRRKKAGSPYSMRWISIPTEERTGGSRLGENGTAQVLCCWTWMIPARSLVCTGSHFWRRRQGGRLTMDTEPTSFSQAA